MTDDDVRKIVRGEIRNLALLLAFVWVLLRVI